MEREDAVETAYKKAIIKLARDMPALIDAMKQLGRSLDNMPRTVRMRY